MLCEKAIAHAEVPDFEDDNKIIDVDMDEKLPALDVHSLLLQKLIQKLKRSPNLVKEFLKLSSGGYGSSVMYAVDGELVIDT